MPQARRDNSAEDLFSGTSTAAQLAASGMPVAAAEKAPLESVMTELDRLSKSFVNSYQTLECQVEKLNGQLRSETEEKHHALKQQQRLLEEKASLSDRLQNLLSILPAGVVVIDGAGQVKDCNAVAVDILGRPLLGQLWIDVINRAFQPQADDGHQISTRDGRKIHIETRALDNEPGQIIVLTDMTKTRELQAELSQQQKLSSMGKMIASLAHQIRTPLSAAILYASHINNRNIDQSLQKQFGENLMERLHYMERQVTDMLNFVKGERKQKDVIRAEQLYSAVEKIKLGFSREVDFQNQLTVQGLTIIADQDAVIGALTNLIENACDACSELAGDANIQVIFSGDSELKIQILDNGSGISQEQQKKIFEPFYTNKNNGNGLGLAVVHGVIIEHKGTIQVYSDGERGTRFEIRLPAFKSQESIVTAKFSQQEIMNEC